MDFKKWVRSPGNADESRFTNEAIPVTDTMIWLCEKCGAKLSGDANENPSRLLQKAFKGLMGAKRRKGEIRAMVTTCMNVCPEARIAAGIVDLKNGKMRFLSFEPGKDLERSAEDLYRQVERVDP